ncbi:MAG TPA: hypothetical protein VLV48_02815, partial [Thermoanaerobaculia bacterium]|nr:hypothetical protein [Thermoanaerobaculia bacterium]
MFSLAAAALLAQGNRPGTPTTPVSGAAAPQVVDRNGTVVGTLSQHTGLAFTLPDGRKTLIGWARNSLGNVSLINFANNSRPMIHFTDANCSGDAYVE